ncbi:MAG: hypothetical protein R3C27_08020 [Hyphomonadaceae bacterium]
MTYYLVPQSEPAVRDGDLNGAQAAPRPAQKRWPMALSIWAAVAVSLAMWAGIVWIISAFMGLFG